MADVFICHINLFFFTTMVLRVLRFSTFEASRSLVDGYHGHHHDLCHDHHDPCHVLANLDPLGHYHGYNHDHDRAEDRIGNRGHTQKNLFGQGFDDRKNGNAERAYLEEGNSQGMLKEVLEYPRVGLLVTEARTVVG